MFTITEELARTEKRDLHIEKALEVTNRIPVIKKKSAIPHVAKCDYFTVDKVNLDGKMMRKIIGKVTDESFASLLVLEGKGTISCNGEEVDFQKEIAFFFRQTAESSLLRENVRHCLQE